MSLTTRHRLNQSRWMEFPMPQDVIDRVHTMARRDNAPRDLTFAWRDGTEIIDENDDIHHDDDSDLEYVPDEQSSDEDNSQHAGYNDDEVFNQGDIDNLSVLAGVVPNEDEDHSEDSASETEVGTTGSQDKDDDNNSDEAYSDEREITGVISDATESVSGESRKEEDEMDRKYGRRNHSIGL